MKNIPETNTPWLYTHDKSIGTEYIKIRQGNSASQKVLREGLIVDINEEGEVVGVEILSQELGKSSDCEKHCKEAKRDILHELLGKTENGGFAPPKGFGSASGGITNIAVRHWAENKLKEL